MAGGVCELSAVDRPVEKGEASHRSVQWSELNCFHRVSYCYQPEPVCIEC